MPHVTFIHGILNKPAADKLYEIWKRSLANADGLDLGSEGVTSSLVYWADVLYENPMADEPGYENAELAESTDLSVRRAEAEPEVKVSDAKSAKEAAFIVGLSAKLNFAAAVDEVIAPVVAESGPQFERIPLPGWLKRGLKYAPLAALTAVIAPEIVMTQGELIDTFMDARLPAVVCASAYYFWRRGILGTILVGMAVYLPLHIGWGW